MVRDLFEELGFDTERDRWNETTPDVTFDDETDELFDDEEIPDDFPDIES